jgi:hypothetical protein
MLLDRERSPLTCLAAAMIVSSVFASVGIILLTAILCSDALLERGKSDAFGKLCEQDGRLSNSLQTSASQRVRSRS